jgi:hypothetical protein
VLILTPTGTNEKASAECSFETVLMAPWYGPTLRREPKESRGAKSHICHVVYEGTLRSWYDHSLLSPDEWLPEARTVGSPSL